MKRIRDEVIEAMERQGWTQLHLSKVSGVAQSTISNYVNEQSDVMTETADKLFVALGLSVKGGRSRAK